MRRLPNYSGCYVCGDENPRGLNVRFEVEDGTVRTEFVPQADHTGYHGRVHGGVRAARGEAPSGCGRVTLERAAMPHARSGLRR